MARGERLAWLAWLSARFCQSLGAQVVVCGCWLHGGKWKRSKTSGIFAAAGNWQPVTGWLLPPSQIPLAAHFIPICGAAFPFPSHLRDVTLVNARHGRHRQGIWYPQSTRAPTRGAGLRFIKLEASLANVRRRDGVVEWSTPNDQRACAVMSMTNANFDAVLQARLDP